jgi:ABC-type polysaccharide/polyol phosphate export permease
MIKMLWGGSAMACIVVALFFLRFYKGSRDVLFLLFALGFALLAVNWIGLALSSVQSEARTYFYILRLGAFLLFLGAIAHKNLKR